MLGIMVGMTRGTVLRLHMAALSSTWPRSRRLGNGMCTVGSAGSMQVVLVSLRLSAGPLPSLHGRALRQLHGLGGLLVTMHVASACRLWLLAVAQHPVSLLEEGC